MKTSENEITRPSKINNKTLDQRSMTNCLIIPKHIKLYYIYSRV